VPIALYAQRRPALRKFILRIELQTTGSPQIKDEAIRTKHSGNETVTISVSEFDDTT
jgi:hypothetical protein